MKPASGSLVWLDEALAALEAAGLRRHRRVIEGSAAGRVAVQGRPLVNFACNDYLALAGDARLSRAAVDATERFGWGSGAAPLVSGYTPAHRRLEETLARFEGTEAALLFSSGYAANVGTITALVEDGDAVFCDRLNHASIVDGCRLSGAKLFVYPHRDGERLEAILKQRGGYRRRLVVSDSLFSMDGDLAPLEELAGLARRYEAMLLIDEAHATGVFGAGGRGVAEEQGVHGADVVRVGTLSKALGSSGGFVSGSRALVEWLLNRARPYMFSTSLPAACCAAAEAAIEIVEHEPQRRQTLRHRAEWFRSRLREAGLDVDGSQSQIVPVMIGDVETALRWSAALEGRGWLVPAIRPPSVPRGGARLRISLSVAHEEGTLERLVRDLVEAGRLVG